MNTDKKKEPCHFGVAGALAGFPEIELKNLQRLLGEFLKSTPPKEKMSELWFKLWKVDADVAMCLEDYRKVMQELDRCAG